MSNSIELSQADIDLAIKASETIGSAATFIGAEKFVFFACFDGTRNDRSEFDSIGAVINKSTSGDPLTTNIGAIFDAARNAQDVTDYLVAKYYKGPGSPGTISLSASMPEAVTSEIKFTS